MTSKPRKDDLANSKRAFVTLTTGKGAHVPEEIGKEMFRLALELDRAQQRIAQLEPLADIGRRVSASRDKPRELVQRKAQYLAVFESALDVLKDGRGHRGLARRVYDRYGGRLNLSERQIRRILKATLRFSEEHGASAV